MPRDDMNIIRASSDDIEALAALFDEYRVFYERESDVEGARDFLRRRLDNDESVVYIAFGGDDGATPLGFVQLYPSFSSVSMKRLWILNDLYVAAAGRRRGVGRALIDRARDLAIETGARGLVLETAVDNVAAQSLYDSYGFVKDTDFYRYFLNV